MQRKFIANLAFLVFVNLLIKPFWILGIDRTVQNTVGTEAYGMYFAIFNFTYLFHILLDFGINNFNNRAVSRDSNRLQDFFGKLITFKLLLSLLYLLVTLSVAWFLGFGAIDFKLLAILAVNQILLSLILYFRSNVAALQLFRIDSILSVLDRSFVIVICAVLLWGNVTKGAFQIEWFVYAQTTGLGLAMIIAFFITVSKVRFFKPQFDWDFIKKIARQSYPFALLGLLMAIYNRVDAVMIERLLPLNGKEEAGIYAASYRLLDAVNMIPFLFTTILLPLFSRMIRQKQAVDDILQLSVKLMISTAILVCGVCFFYRMEIMELLYPASTDYWAEIFGWIILSFSAISVIYIYGSLLTANGSLKRLNIIAFSGLGLNVALNFVLIPQHAAMGATIATIVTQLLVALAHIYAVRRALNLKSNIRIFLALMILALVVSVSGYFITMHLASWMAGALLLLGIGLVASFVLRLIEPRSMLQLLVFSRNEDAA